ncbi:MAG TPA: DUF190 domain-containing protein [Spirochaetota bacterium]|nr:DUF190 domain-containing protein [Spirochaetota bacterium]HOM38818.1 DUF190 domain-containing protein [Spirochaetota bacterium]HPQ49876.1 DUF190 domain-containing protein [Spirochaetota bacterium]
MDNFFNSLKMSIYLSEEKKHGKVVLYKYILEKIEKFGIEGVSVIKGMAGYGRNHHIHTIEVWRLSTNLPVIIEVVSDKDKIVSLIDELKKEIKDILIVLEPVHVIRL